MYSKFSLRNMSLRTILGVTFFIILSITGVNLVMMNNFIKSKHRYPIKTFLSKHANDNAVYIISGQTYRPDLSVEGMHRVPRSIGPNTYYTLPKYITVMKGRPGKSWAAITSDNTKYCYKTKRIKNLTRRKVKYEYSHKTSTKYKCKQAKKGRGISQVEGVDIMQVYPYQKIRLGIESNKCRRFNGSAQSCHNFAILAKLKITTSTNNYQKNIKAELTQSLTMN